MRRAYALTPLALASLWLSGCALAALPLLADSDPEVEVARLTSDVYRALDAAAPVQITTGDVSVPYDELAILSARARWDIRASGGIDDLNRRLRATARRLGADAVVRVDYDVVGRGDDSVPWQTATGTAVRTRPAE